jgi:hypothetical protein
MPLHGTVSTGVDPFTMADSTFTSRGCTSNLNLNRSFTGLPRFCLQPFISNASELFAQSSSFHRQPARGDALREPVWTFASRRAHSGLGANVPVRCGIEISVPVVLAVSEDDAGRVSCGQFVQRSGRSRDLLASNAKFPSQCAGPHH